MEHLDVLIVGAGLSGIGAGHYVQTHCPWASYAIFEARDAIGGTWDLFRYPGVRSDSDMFTLGYPFRPWDGDKAIADGWSILQYIKDTAAEGGIDEHIRLNHRIVKAEWCSGEAGWHVTAERTNTGETGATRDTGETRDTGTGDTGETVQLTCGFLFSCSGYYRYDHGYVPDFAGMDRFQGILVHPQAWPEDLDYSGKRVVVVGSGATAVTLVPSMAEAASHVTMLQRSPSYIVSAPEKNPIADWLRKWLPERYAGGIIRWVLALLTQGFYQLSQRRPTFVKRLLRRGTERQLEPGYDIDTHFTPRYNPWDQRLCLVPDGDLFKAIRTGSASVVTDDIDTFTEGGVLLKSGQELEADVVVTATGLDLLFAGGVQLSVDGDEVDVPNRLTYKGMMLEGVPNLAIAIGYTNASWTLKCSLTCEYVCRLLNHLHDTGQRQCLPVNHDGSVTPRPLLSLSSGYVQRSAHRFPKQGSRFPWQVHQSYLRDYGAMKLRRIDDDAMVFSNPVSAVDTGAPSLLASGRRR